MRAWEACGEATRNLVSGTTRAGVLFVLAWVLGTALLAFDAMAIGALQTRAHELRAHAGNIRIVVAEGAIDPVACARLGELNGVAASGAIWGLDSISLQALPNIDVPAYRISRGVAEMLDFPGFHDGSVYVPAALAERWHATAGTRLDTSDAVLAVAGVFSYSESDGRDPRLSSAISIAGETSEFASECWFAVWPITTAMDSYALGSLAPSVPQDVTAQVIPLNASVGDRHDLAGEFATRATGALTPLVVLVFAALGFAGMRARRLEIASNLHAGAKPAIIGFTAAIESAVWASAAALAMFSCTRIIAVLLMREPLDAYEASLAATSALSALAAVAGALFVVFLTREDRLFSIFKAR